MSGIDTDLDYILQKTEQLFRVVEEENYPLLETKELVRHQLIQQFFKDYSPEEIATVSKKFEYLVARSDELNKQCESIFEKTKQDMLKLKKSASIKKAYK